MGAWAPPLTLRETRLGCRLTLGGLAHGSGTTLQEAADELVLRVVATALAVHARNVTFTPGLLPEPRSVEFLREVAEVAAHAATSAASSWAENGLERRNPRGAASRDRRRSERLARRVRRRRGFVRRCWRSSTSCAGLAAPRVERA